MRTIRIGDCELVLVASTHVEAWSYEYAASRLHEVTEEHWAGREDLLRLSDHTLGPDDDVDAAVRHLARLIDCGELIAIREAPTVDVGLVRTDDGRWDAPRLVDLRRDRPSTRDDDDRRTRRDTPTTPPRDPSPRTTGDRPTDTWTTFVAYAVFDQHGNPLGGTSRCIVDGARHEHALAGEAIEVQPIAAHAHVVLELAELEAEAP